MHYKPYTDRKRITYTDKLASRVYIYRRIKAHRYPVTGSNPAKADNIETRGLTSG